MKTHFTSDTHFNHKNIIEYSNRPYTDINHMTEMLVQNWNSVVDKGDTVIHVGDFAMGDKEQIPGIRKRLNGRIVLVLGNHDYDRRGQILKPIQAGGFDEMYPELTIEVDGIMVYVRHEPKLDFRSTAEVPYHICGHVHDAWNRKGHIINAGMDVRGYKPITLNDMINDAVEVTGRSHRGY